MREPQPSSRRVYDMVLPESRAIGAMWMTWLIRFRWVAIGSILFIVSIGFPAFTHRVWSLTGIAGIVGLLVVGNQYAQGLINRKVRVRQEHVYNQLLLDVACLTGLFMLTGGYTNPFVILYFVHVTMAVIMVTAPYAVAIMFGIALSYTVVSVWYLPLDFSALGMSAKSAEQVGGLVAFLVTSSAVGVMCLGMANSLRMKTRQLAKLEREDLPLATGEYPLELEDDVEPLGLTTH